MLHADFYNTYKKINKWFYILFYNLICGFLTILLRITLFCFFFCFCFCFCCFCFCCVYVFFSNIKLNLVLNTWLSTIIKINIFFNSFVLNNFFFASVSLLYYQNIFEIIKKYLNDKIWYLFSLSIVFIFLN
jgi:hypothetical protein